jgi:hypothetical protein
MHRIALPVKRLKHSGVPEEASTVRTAAAIKQYDTAPNSEKEKGHLYKEIQEGIQLLQKGSNCCFQDTGKYDAAASLF